MKLEVGKKYVMRDNPDIKWVRVDAIRPELKGRSCVCSTYMTKDLVFGHFSYCENGSWNMLGDDDSNFDLVAEYKEPELHITEKDVGRKVRLKNGSVAMIIGIDIDNPYYPVNTGLYDYTYDGILTIGETRNKDILEFID